MGKIKMIFGIVVIKCKIRKIRKIICMNFSVRLKDVVKDLIRNQH
jgi:hypothetical protein